MTIEEPQQPITVLEIQEFEKEFNLILPENFKKFYLKFNGGFVYDDDDDLTAMARQQRRRRWRRRDGRRRDWI